MDGVDSTATSVVPKEPRVKSLLEIYHSWLIAGAARVPVQPFREPADFPPARRVLEFRVRVQRKPQCR